MADEVRDDTLEDFLNRATNPANRDEDVDDISKFCDQVNKELEGPQIAVRLLAHKIQSPQEREALYALATLEACMKHCGRRFHQEVGKFRFLNEIIKVISPKYLGSRTTEKVKKKCIELMYSWQKGLPHEPKMLEAYTMLKTQGIVKEDPTYMDQKFDFPKPEERKAAFEDEEKSKLLSKLLKSKNPEDLQAANRLIKSMVKQDAEKMEKISRRINELETIHTNVKLLGDMVEHYNSQTTTDSEREMMKELYESLEKLRPKLFRLASDTEENDTDGLNAILKANDEVSVIMMDYKKKVEGIQENGQGDKKGGSSLLDLNSDLNLPHTPASPTGTDGTSIGLASAALDDELLSLGLKSSSESHNSITKESLLSELDDIFSSTEQPNQNASHYIPNFATEFAAFSSTSSGLTQTIGQSLGYSQPIGQPFVSSVGINQPLGQPVISNAGFSQTAGHSPVGINPPIGQSVTSSAGLNQPMRQPVASNTGFKQPVGHAHKQGVNYNPVVETSVFDNTPKQAAPTSMSQSQVKAMEDLDVLGQSLMQQTVTDKPKVSFPQSQAPAPKVPLNQLASKAQTTPKSSAPVFQSSPVSMVTHPPPVASVSGSTITTVTTPTKVEIQPLTDVFVPLENIQPGTTPPVTAYDKNGLKILIHLAKNKPRDDVSVMVVSVMSTNTSPVKGFVFQAAVPKIMKVKLQPPSATDLPAFNPILPPAAITQVMLLANPNKEKIRLKYKLTYSMNDQNFSDVGDVEGFPVQS